MTASTLPAGRALSLQIDRDGAIKRGLMLVIALYLVVALALPLYTMLSKSFVTYSFDLTRYEFQVSDDSGTSFGPITSAFDLNQETSRLGPDDLHSTSEGRLPAPDLFADFSFRSPVTYRIRATEPGTSWLVGLERVASQDWVQYDSNSFRRVSLLPATSTGIQNYTAYFSNPALSRSIFNSLFIASVSTVLTVLLAFGFAYALNRSCMRFKGAMKLIAMMPILVPSLLPGIGLIYLFGNQGLLKGLLMGQSIYGPLGIVIGSVFFTFPHALIIISTALAISDQRQYEAADSLRASPLRTFLTVTLPGARYGLISAAFVTFTLVITDFGLPKVIGGQYSVLAIDIYKQVIGQQNFEMGAVVSVLLLIPAVLAFLVDRQVQKKQVSLLTAKSVPYQPKPNAAFDLACLGWCGLIALFILAIIGTCQLAALVKLWPYDMSLSLGNYAFDRMDGGGWGAYWNSITLAGLTAVLGTVIVFTGAYMVEKIDGFRFGRGLFQFLAMLPMAVPGMVLGLAYIFFFNNPANPLNAIYGTMAILVLSTVTHFYTVGHLTGLTALKQIDAEFEPVAASMRQPFYRVFTRVTVPICLPAILDIMIYLFVNAMTTVSAVVFIYSTHTALASIAVLNMDDAGDIAPAAAMGMMIFYTNVAARLLHALLSRRLLAATQRWRVRST
ncbi:putative 2-aminoethylphosphonate ABC transporter permease subunit [Paracoccus zhejiangensis]|uniref:Putative 2-aminoethylphosphonate ABC transporter permease subunit n=1 Tax=Paracoccus zhejiangensis TaxID=1077935 RepID=A0A2H5F230_9RHOB|nr:putative 2-aminoethylphosphonate ABC transporter permease subunit [Paracoccus zhejiangensis]AUH65582.1 putative 2-aminoethylphosphonate ABC transporter permease subunit [Paracoccus zhejiangensis]